jgi:hypothetical protein
MFNNFFFENFSICEIMWKNIVKPGRPQMTIWRLRIACWITKATNARSECVIFIAFALQQWLQKRASVLRHMCVACVRKLEGSLRSANGDAGRIFSV